MYGTIVVDPPWDYDNPGEFKDGPNPVARGANSKHRYGSMSTFDIFRTIAGANQLVGDDAHLYLWTTNAFIPEAFWIVEQLKADKWRPITFCTWLKTTHEDACEHGNPKVSGRTGYYFRGATEHFLFAAKGKATERPNPPLPTAFLWPRTPHSVKPEAFYDLVERVSPGSYLELWARRNRLGWDTWGNESLSHVDL